MYKKSDIHPSWGNLLQAEFKAGYMNELSSFLTSDERTHRVFPPMEQIFECFNRTPVNKVKVVVLGQDPYHGFGQAHGLSFSVKGDQKIPPSLKNIIKELHLEFADFRALNGDLSCWADQGVLLMNSALTVRKSDPGSHQNRGWERFTDAAIQQLSEVRENAVFLLWGKFAQSKVHLIDQSKHLLLMAPHPSPFSAHRGFFGCGHFAKTNEFLIENGYEPIDWNIN